MKTIVTTIRRLLDWLGEQQPTADEMLSPTDWSDLPTYHPASDTGR